MDEITQELRERTVESFFDFLILTNLRKKSSMSVDDLMDYIHQKFGISLSLGVLYSSLLYLEKAGLIHEDFTIRKHARVRTVYRITQKGREKIDISIKHKNSIQWVISRIFEG